MIRAVWLLVLNYMDIRQHLCKVEILIRNNYFLHKTRVLGGLLTHCAACSFDSGTPLAKWEIFVLKMRSWQLVSRKIPIGGVEKWKYIETCCQSHTLSTKNYHFAKGDTRIKWTRCILFTVVTRLGFTVMRQEKLKICSHQKQKLSILSTLLLSLARL